MTSALRPRPVSRPRRCVMRAGLAPIAASTTERAPVRPEESFLRRSTRTTALPIGVSRASRCLLRLDGQRDPRHHHRCEPVPTRNAVSGALIEVRSTSNRLDSWHRRRIVHVAVSDHPRPHGRPSNSATPFPRTKRRGTCCTTAMPPPGVVSTIGAMQIHEVLTAARSTWQNAYVARVIGSIRREGLDHVIVLSVAGLQRVLADYVTHLHEHEDAPQSRQGRTGVTPLQATLCRTHRRDCTG
jgi:hypothetical protein